MAVAASRGSAFLELPSVHIAVAASAFLRGSAVLAHDLARFFRQLRVAIVARSTSVRACKNVARAARVIERRNSKVVGLLAVASRAVPVGHFLAELLTVGIRVTRLALMRGSGEATRMSCVFHFVALHASDSQAKPHGS